MASKPENTPAEELADAVVESEVPTGAESYLEENKTKIAALVCLIVLGSAAYIVFSNLSKQKSLAAANAFTNAQTAEQYRQVAIDHQGTVAGGNALLMRADLEKKENDSQAAFSTLTEFVASYQSHPRYVQGLFALAEHAQDSDNLTEARSQFQAIVDKNPDSEIAPLALMRVGDIALAEKKYDEARGIYTSIPGRFPANPFIPKISQKIELLNLESPPPDLRKPETTPDSPAQTPQPATATTQSDGPATSPPPTAKKSIAPAGDMAPASSTKKKEQTPPDTEAVEQEPSSEEDSSSQTPTDTDDSSENS
ncbi:MAG: tetratricopeptide repeat protein [Verrucomicrobiota bacterium]